MQVEFAGKSSPSPIRMEETLRLMLLFNATNEALLSIESVRPDL